MYLLSGEKAIRIEWRHPTDFRTCIEPVAAFTSPICLRPGREICTAIHLPSADQSCGSR